MNNVRNLSFVGICMAFVVIALGAWTRLVDAGLGCPDWPGCYGFVFWPNDEAEIALAESRFPMFPYGFCMSSYGLDMFSYDFSSKYNTFHQNSSKLTN